MQERSRRVSQSISNEHHQVAVYTFEDIEKYMYHAYNILRAKCKEKKYEFEERKLQDLYNTIKNAYKKMRKYNEQKQQQIKELKDLAIRDKQQHLQEISACRNAHNQHTNTLQHAIIERNNALQHARQEHTSNINKMLQVMNKAAALADHKLNQLTTKCQVLVRTLQTYYISEPQNREADQMLRRIMEDIRLKRDNSLISRKSDEMSFDEMDLYPSQPSKNCPQLSHPSPSQLYHPTHTSEEEMQLCVQRLIALGFFCDQNQAAVSKMFEITRALGNPLELLSDPFYPLFLEIVRLNTKKVQVGLEYENRAQQEPVELRNIEHISQLDINESNFSDVIHSHKFP